MQKPWRFIITIFLATVLCRADAQVSYPYPVKKFTLAIEGQKVQMAYMDIAPATASGKNILLLHGKNFNGYYWKDVIPFFLQKGYRVIVPDQAGWGRSDHPNLHYSFHMLASNTKQLLDSLGIEKICVLGHSMGGMLAARFVFMYPGMVDRLILEDPIGLEDYKTFVPYQSLQQLYEKEKQADYASYKKYQQSYYPVWKPEYEQYVQAQAADLQSPDFDNIARANAITYQMIYEQPVCYEFSRINVPTLLIIGQADRTIVGKELLTEEEKNKHGQYPALGRKTQALIKGSVLKEIPGVGHIPHVQELGEFEKAVDSFLK